MQDQGARVVWERSLRVVWELGETVGQESWVKEWDERDRYASWVRLESEVGGERVGWEVREWVAKVGCKSGAGCCVRVACKSEVREWCG